MHKVVRYCCDRIRSKFSFFACSLLFLFLFCCRRLQSEGALKRTSKAKAATGTCEGVCVPQQQHQRMCTSNNNIRHCSMAQAHLNGTVATDCRRDGVRTYSNRLHLYRSSECSNRMRTGINGSHHIGRSFGRSVSRTQLARYSGQHWPPFDTMTVGAFA